MRVQSRDGIAERPFLRFIGWAIAARIVARRMAFDTVSVVFDQRCAQIGARPFSSPLRRGIDGEEIVSIHAQAGKAIADGARGEGCLLAAGDSLKARYRPLVVDDVQDHGRPKDGAEIERVVKIAFRRRALADPGRRDTVVMLVGRGHRPTHRLAELRAQISGDREETVFAA